MLVGIGWLDPKQLKDWRRGRVDYLERVVHANLSRISEAMKLFRSWAAAGGLRASEQTMCDGHGGTGRDSGPARAATLRSNGATGPIGFRPRCRRQKRDRPAKRPSLIQPQPVHPTGLTPSGRVGNRRRVYRLQPRSAMTILATICSNREKYPSDPGSIDRYRSRRTRNGTHWRSQSRSGPGCASRKAALSNSSSAALAKASPTPAPSGGSRHLHDLAKAEHLARQPLFPRSRRKSPIHSDRHGRRG